MYGVILIYSFLLGLLSYVVFQREVWILILFWIFFEIGIYSSYNYYEIAWSAPRRISLIAIYFLGYFIPFIIYGDQYIHDNYVTDNI